jgi:hypothetical protein
MRFPINVWFTAKRASLLLLNPFADAIATVNLFAVGTFPEGRTDNKGADGAFKVFGNLLPIDRLLGA